MVILYVHSLIKKAVIFYKINAFNQLFYYEYISKYVSLCKIVTSIFEHHLFIPLFFIIHHLFCTIISLYVLYLQITSKLKGVK